MAKRTSKKIEEVVQEVQTVVAEETQTVAVEEVVVDLNADVKEEQQTVTEVSEVAGTQQDGKSDEGESSIAESLNEKAQEEMKKAQEENNKKKSKKVSSRRTAMDSSEKGVSVKDVVKLNEQGKLNFDLLIQRKKAWNKMQKSLWIHTLLYGYAFPPVYAQGETTADGKVIYHMLDGKQRLTTIIDFIEDKFALDKKTPSIFGHEIAGKKYSELVGELEELKDELRLRKIKFEIYNDMTEEERDEMFVRLQGGKPLSKTEVIRAMYSGMILDLQDVCSHNVFVDFFIFLNDNSRNKFQDQELALQIDVLLATGYNETKGLGGSQIEAHVKALKEQGKSVNIELINKISNFLEKSLDQFSPDALKVIQKTDVPTLYSFLDEKLKEKSITQKELTDFIQHFFIEGNNKETYNEFTKSGTSSKNAVLNRVQELKKAFDSFRTTLKV